MFGKINDAYDTVKNGLDAQINLATAEQKEQLANAKLALAELKEMMADLKDDNRQLKETISLQEELQYGNSGAAWIDGHPFCAGCLGARQSKVRLSHVGSDHYRCPSCGSPFIIRGSEKREFVSP